MSTATARILPLDAPSLPRAQRQVDQTRHIEIVSTRSQRRARPRPIYAIVLVGGLFVLFIAQLLMSIVVSDGAYQISSLQGEQRDLTRTADALSEKNDLLASPQSLGAAASKQGMVQTDRTPAFINTKKGTIIGKAKVATNGKGDELIPSIANQPLESSAKADKAASKKAASETSDDEPETNTTASSVGEQDALSANAGTAIDTAASKINARQTPAKSASTTSTTSTTSAGVLPSPTTH